MLAAAQNTVDETIEKDGGHFGIDLAFTPWIEAKPLYALDSV
jgi:hypothetical protein